MLRLIALCCVLVFASPVFARTILVRNAGELEKANNAAQPGDTILFQNGTWKDIVMKLNCSGTSEKPIVFKAQTAGKVIISGSSQLRLGGNYIIVEGLLFTNGYSPSNTVIDFRISNKELANNCRVTNSVINDFNKPKRMSDDSWVSFSGKNNRVDHCSFLNKKNLGVLLAVILDDDRSRENFHSIDHNYFGVRAPLASNGGEIIRVGLAEHSLFNSNTQITDNFFEYCDGEAEVISIKSGSNIVSNNIFKECQGSVVLRHGNDNTVTNNLFLGNGKEGTGGVRIINRGQWIINNFFYKCRGESFRSPLAIMNGIPNSPPTRYVQVTDAVVMNNSFVDCAYMSLGEGSDVERNLAADHVLFARNIFYNTKDSVMYKAWDRLSGIQFLENKASYHYTQALVPGFKKTFFKITKVNNILVPVAPMGTNRTGLDSLRNINKERLPDITSAPGFAGLGLIRKLQANAYTSCGARWYIQKHSSTKPINVSCQTATDVYRQIAKHTSALTIHLTGTQYTFDKAIIIDKEVQFTSAKQNLQISSSEFLPALFVIKKGTLSLLNINLSAEGLKAHSFIASDTAGSSEHYSVNLKNVSVKNLQGCENIFVAHKSTLADSIIVQNCSFTGIRNGFWLAGEKDNRGYYNVEKMKIANSHFSNGDGVLLNLYRGGSDESTLGPDFLFTGNTISEYNASNTDALIQLTGVQKSRITRNIFNNSNASKILILYKDTVRANHYLANNRFTRSGVLQKNDFVTAGKNTIL